MPTETPVQARGSYGTRKAEAQNCREVYRMEKRGPRGPCSVAGDIGMP